MIKFLRLDQYPQGEQVATEEELNAAREAEIQRQRELNAEALRQRQAEAARQRELNEEAARQAREVARGERDRDA